MKQQIKSLFTLFAAVLLSFTITACSSTRTTKSAGEVVDDAVISTRVKTAFINDATLKATEIQVETFKGTVQLSGFVNSQAEIARAGTVAKGIPGVTAVKNDIRVK